MDRKKFIKNGIVGLGSAVIAPSILHSCSTDSNNPTTGLIPGNCELSPSETAGPFPIKTPSELVRENIISDRNGIALLITLTIQNQSNNCEPFSDIFVDIWHCDAEGEYSEYGGTQMQSTDYSTAHFLRGRQTTNANGQVSFISIFPGWYPSRAPHIHLEVLNSNGNSLKISQIAFPKNICDLVYATNGYNESADTTNNGDNIFSDSLDGNIADSITGNNTDGYTLFKTIIV